MARQQPIMTSGEHRVIPFRRRALARPPADPPETPRNQAVLHLVRPAPKDLAPAQHLTSSGRDDYQRRMIVNVTAMVFTFILIAVAVWLATTITELRQTQDCLMVGRRDCGEIPLPQTVMPRAADSL
jgi:hypothetical protein